MKKQRIKSLILALVVLVASIPLTMLAAEEEESLPIYNAYNDYSITQNPNGVWSYQYREDKTVSTADESSYKNLVRETNSDKTWKNSNDTGAILQALIVKADNALRVDARQATSEAVLTFTAPYTGKISVSMANGGVSATASNQFAFKMLHNGIAVSETSVGNIQTGQQYFTGTVELSVIEGDTVRFVVELLSGYSAGVTALNPAIAYSFIGEVLPEYNAYNNYSVTQNPNGVWSYQYREDKTVSTADESSYKNLVRETNSDKTWKNSNDTGATLQALIVKTDNALRVDARQATSEAVLTFTAPYTGKISVSMANGGVSATASNQFAFKMLHNGVSVTEVAVGNIQTGQAYFTDAVELTVEEGDTVRFVVDLLSSYTAGVTALNPAIVYTHIGEVLPEYNAYKEYSIEQNPNGVWSYQYREDKTVSTADESSYKNLVRETNSDKTWKNSNDTGATLQALIVKTDNALRVDARQATSEAVLTFTAPYSGKINVSMANGGVSATASNQFAFKMLHNGIAVSETSVGNIQTGQQYFTGTVELEVREGDTVRFVVDLLSSYTAGITALNPAIAYTYVGEVMPKYNAHNEYSIEQNPNGVWSYQYREDKAASTTDETTYKNMVREVTNGVASDKTWKNSNDAGATFQALIVKTDNALRVDARQANSEAVLTFTAPYSGKISVSMANGGVSATTSNQFAFRMLHNGELVEGTHLESMKEGDIYLSEALELTVQEGDTVRFVVDLLSDYVAGVTSLNPEISYISWASYNAYDEYSVQQNPNGVWSYQYRENKAISTADETTYKNLVRETNSDVTWKNTNSGTVLGMIIKSENAFGTGSIGGALRVQSHDSAAETVLTFVAPYSGTVSIDMANGGVYVNGAGTYGFNLLHNGEEVSGASVASLQTGTTNFMGPIELNVERYDTIRFVVDLVGSYTNGLISLINPEITYIKMDAVQPELGTYYVSSSEGKDTNNGLSPETPWKSFSKLQELELDEGNGVYLKAGDTWNEQLILNGVSGTKENPVIISTYGDGMATLDLQLVENDSTNISELAVPVVLLNNAEGVEISNLSVTGSGIGIDLHYENSFNNEYVKISNCTFTGLKGFRQATASETQRERGAEDRYYTAGAICTTVTNNTVGITDPALIGLYIDKCATNDCGTLYTTNQSPYFLNESGALVVHGFYMTDCTMTDNDYYGTIIGGIKGGYMDGCIITGCGDDSDFKPGTAGIMISATDFAIINTEISEQQRGGQVYDGVAVDLEQSCKNVTVSNCYFHDNTGAGMLIYDSGKEGTDGANVECTVTNCYFEDNLTKATGSTEEHNDPYADIRILSSTGYALMNSTISNNKYMNNVEGVSGYSFYGDYQSWIYEMAANNKIEQNSEVDAITFAKDSTLTATFAETFGLYNDSKYTALPENYVGRTKLLEEAIQAAYKFTDGYSSTADGVWRYQYYDISDTKTWQSLTYSNEWKYGVSGVISKSSSTGEGIVNPNTVGTIAIGFCAPQTGRIRIEMARDFYLRQVNGDGDGVYISVLNGDMKLVCEPIDLKASGSFSAEFPEVYVDVKKDECIYICVSKKSDTKYDSTRVEPIINYVYTFDTINEEEGLDVKDIVRLKRYMEDNTVTADAYNADLNGDGVYDGKDASILRKYLVGGVENTLN